MEIKPTSGTPLFRLNEDIGYIELKGRSISESIEHFYNNVHLIINDYLKENSIHVIDIFFDYMNSKTQRYLMTILKELQNKNIVINWYFEEDDDSIIFVGETFKSILNLEFNLKPYTK
jgi:hypothetical protein